MGDRHPGGSRRWRFVAAMALGSILLGAACAPLAPAPPKVTASLSISGGDTMPGLVQLDAQAFRFRSDPISPNYDVAWVARDAATHAVVASNPAAVGNPDGHVVVQLQPGLFTATVEGAEATVAVEMEVTMQRGGSTASRSTAASLSWTMPASPITGSLPTTSIYSVIRSFPAVCSPVGTEVHVSISGATSHAVVGFADMTVPFGSNFVAFDANGEATLTTTTACWTPVIGRGSFVGDLSGTMDYTLSW